MTIENPDLNRELPDHPIQQWIKFQHEKKAKEYWERINNVREKYHSSDGADKEKEWVTITEATQILHLGEHTIRILIRNQEIETFKKSGRRFVNVMDVKRKEEKNGKSKY
jgi:hypothetical protein